MLDPASFRARFAAPDAHPDGPLPHNLVAVIMAFGSRFSDHPIIAHDRDEFTARDNHQDDRSRSRIVQLLVIRAREIAEATKTHRVASIDNVQVLILLESLCARTSELPLGSAPTDALRSEMPFTKDSESEH